MKRENEWVRQNALIKCLLMVFVSKQPLENVVNLAEMATFIEA